MDDPIAQQLRELLQITMKLCQSIDELLGGLREVEKAIVKARSRNWRRQPE